MQAIQNYELNCLAAGAKIQSSLHNLSETSFISLFSRDNKERLNGLPI